MGASGDWLVSWAGDRALKEDAEPREWRWRESGAFRGQQAPAERLGDGGRAVAHPELGVGVQQVGLDGGLADEEPGRRLAVGGAAGDYLQDLDLPLAERRLDRPADLAEQPGRHRR